MFKGWPVSLGDEQCYEKDVELPEWAPKGHVCIVGQEDSRNQIPKHDTTCYDRMSEHYMCISR